MDADPSPRPAPRPERWRAVAGLLAARWRGHLAGREERRACTALGVALAARGGDPAGERSAAALAAVHLADGELRSLERADQASLEQDRADYPAVPRWLRPVVVARGVATRALLGHRGREARATRAAACAALGRAALAEPPPGDYALAPLLEAGRAARDRARSAAGAEGAARGALEGWVALAVAGHLGRELVALGRPLTQELRGRLLPRAPALAGLAVGWWIASTFTDSGFLATLHALGIGRGPRRRVSGETLRAMQFWLPLLAAAACSYLSSRAGALVRARYQPPPRRQGTAGPDA
jgi:hypothetical protein